MSDASTHSEVPTRKCLGPDGSAARVSETLAIIGGRWKLAILFRLFAQSPIRYLALLRQIDRVTPKVLTQHLRELEADGLVDRTDFHEKPKRVEYALSMQGRALVPVLLSLRDFARDWRLRTEDAA